MAEEKVEEAPEWLKLVIVWLFVIVGVPSIASALWKATIQYTFETATTGYQIFLGLGFIVCFIFYIYFGWIQLIKWTRNYFGI